MKKNKTCIFISHRLASTKFCDRIILLKDGKIIEEGTHDELMKLKKLVNNMWKYYYENILLILFKTFFSSMIIPPFYTLTYPAPC